VLEFGGRAFVDRARAMLALAESVDASAPGAAGLAYQAANLALKILMIEVDGTVPWAHDAWARRGSELTGVAADDLLFIHRVRQLDFYADAAAPPPGQTGWGAMLEAPSVDDRRRAATIARRLFDAVDLALAARAEPGAEH